jgi:hypothetical protein
MKMILRMETFQSSTTDLKLARFPTRSPLPYAALPSISLIPSARFTDITDETMIKELSGEIIGAAMAVLVMSSGVETSLDSGF